MKILEYVEESSLTLNDPDLYDFITDNYDEIKSRLCVDQIGQKIYSYLLEAAESDLYDIYDAIEKFIRCYIKYNTITSKDDKYCSYGEMIVWTKGLKHYINNSALEILDQEKIDYIVYKEYSQYVAYKYGLGDCSIFPEKKDIDLSIFTKEFLFDKNKLDGLLEKFYKEVYTNA